MDNSGNPYVSPLTLAGDTMEPPALNKRLLTAWAAVVAANTIVPLAMAILPTEYTGRWGMLAAIAIVLVSGWYFCYAFPVLGRKLIAGSVLTALSQILPIAQFVAGIVGLALANSMGLFVEGNDSEPDRFVNEFGGFIATMTTGTILVVGSFVLGWLVAFFLPKRWFYSSPVQSTPA